MDHGTSGETRNATIPTQERDDLQEVAETPVSPVGIAPGTRPDLGEAPVGTQPDPALCPRCGGKLVNPGSLGWCRNCVYCQSLENETAQGILNGNGSRKASALGLMELYEVAQRTPPWVWALLGGFTALLLGSVILDNVFPKQDSLLRAVWTTAQIVIGLLAIIGAQIWLAILIVSQTDEDLSPKDFLFSFKLWNLAIAYLPQTRKPVTLGGWGLTAIMSGFCLIGGLGYWWQFYKPARVANTGLRIAAQNQVDAAGRTLEESLQDFANTQDLTKDKNDPNKDESAKVDTRPAVECVVIGYLVEGDRLAGLVLATAKDDRLQFAGVVRKGFTDKVTRELSKKLAMIEILKPLIPNLSLSAIWVKPEVFCEVHQSGIEADGKLIAPNFKVLMK